MKHIIIILFVFLCFIMQSLHAENKTQTGFTQDLIKKVLIPDSLDAQRNLMQIKMSLHNLKSSGDREYLDRIQSDFKGFIKSWKAVEAVYIAGALDDDFLDHPRFIDYFHQGNESIPDLVERAVNSDTVLQNSLFKNSTKSINALEYLLFSKPEKSSLLDGLMQRDERRIEASLIVVNNILTWLNEISGLYQSDQILLVDDSNSIGLVVNALIDSSYKLANWRVGEAGGLVKKYQGKPSSAHLEYPVSSFSLIAIKAILQTHRKIIDREGEQDLLAVSREKSAETELLFIRKIIDQALIDIKEVPEPLSMHLEDKRYKKLYQRLSQLHDAYYFMLIDSLGLNVKIIDADGD